MMMATQNWPELRIGDLGEVVTGRTPPTERSSCFGEDFPFITPGDMHQGKYARETQRSLSLEGAELLKRIKVPANSVCVSCIGWQMGEVVMTDRPSFSNQQLNTIVPNGKIDASFLYYSLRTRKQELLSLGSATGVRTPILNKSAFSDTKIAVPPLPVQQIIAGILSAYDDLIENSQRRIKILDSMARALYREWFVHFRFPGHESVPHIASSLGEIPQGWEVRKLGDLAEEMRRNIRKGGLEEEQPYVGLEHIPRRSLALDAWEKTNELGSNKLVFKKGEILFGKIRPYFHKVSIAPFDGLCSADTIVIRARQPENYAIVAGCVSSDEFVAHATATSNGSKMPRANWQVLEDYPVAIPTLEIARQFSAVIEPSVRQMQTLIFQTINLRSTRDLLLPRLLNGQINVDTLARS